MNRLAKKKKIYNGSQEISTLEHIKKHPTLYMLLIPGLVFLIVFKYVPMLGIIISFQNFSPITGYFGSPWAGLQHFKNLFMSPDFARLFKNTLTIALYDLLLCFPAPIILALLLNEIKSVRYKRITQTLVYVPHFISFVIIASLTYNLFNINDGLVNQIITMFQDKPVDFLADPNKIRALLTGQKLWRNTGYGTIVYLAALAGVDTELYEAAKVDGAGRLRLLWHITLPALRSTIVVLLILQVGKILSTGHEQIFLMQNSLNISKAEVFDTYVYTRGIVQGQYSYATAVGLFKSIVGMIMVVGTNKLANIMGERGIS